MDWFEPQRPENLLEEESGNIKVGVGDRFGSKSQISEITTFCLVLSFPDGFRALNCSWVLAGANFIACGAAVRSTTWLVETILVIVSRNRTSNIFVEGVGHEILVEEKIRDMVARFGS